MLYHSDGVAPPARTCPSICDFISPSDGGHYYTGRGKTGGAISAARFPHPPRRDRRYRRRQRRSRSDRFLLSRPDIHVEAITIENGMAHVPAGGNNVLRLLALADMRTFPFFSDVKLHCQAITNFPRRGATRLTNCRASRCPKRRAPSSRVARPIFC